MPATRHLTVTSVVPVVALVVLGVALSLTPGPVLLTLSALLLGAAVMAAVHHAEVVAHKVGEPFGSLVLAVAVTVIEVSLIITLMLAGGDDAETLARDTVFAAVLITTNGIVGLSLLMTSRRHETALFNAEGTGAALASVCVLATTTLVLPNFTTSHPGPVFSGPQLAFAAIASLAVYAMFVSTQTYRHRDFFLPVRTEHNADGDDHADPPSRAEAWVSLGLLMVALVAVVGLAKVESPVIKGAVSELGLPASFVGVVIAMLVLAPETLAAANAARRDRTQISLNLAYGSALASIGLTVPVIAVATLFIDIPVHLGISNVQLVLLALTCVVSVLTVVPGRATRLQGGLHLVLFAAYLFLSIAP